jgi:hypothetical protein
MGIFRRGERKRPSTESYDEQANNPELLAAEAEANEQPRDPDEPNPGWSWGQPS